jgi:Fe-Mn family superoxide dismutase
MNNSLMPLVLASMLAWSPLSNAAEAAVPTATATTAPQQQQYSAKNFDDLIGKVPGLNDDLLKMHFKLYQGYVTNSNSLLQKIAVLNAKGDNRSPEFAGLKHMLGWEFDGMLLHEYYFENLGKTALPADDSPLMAKIKNDFGSYDNWKTDFVATGLMRGIGWVIAYIEPKEGRLINVWINEHDLGHLAGGKPLLVMDVFEHAYITQFGLERGKYVDVFFDNINWDAVSKRFDSAPQNKAKS